MEYMNMTMKEKASFDIYPYIPITLITASVMFCLAVSSCCTVGACFRMRRELTAFYEQLERTVQQEIALSRRKMAEAETELLQLTELYNRKNTVSDTVADCSQGCGLADRTKSTMSMSVIRFITPARTFYHFLDNLYY